jgi:hypothetical protein
MNLITNALVKNAWSYTSTPQLSSIVFIAWCLSKYQKQLHVYLNGTSIFPKSFKLFLKQFDDNSYGIEYDIHVGWSSTVVLKQIS